LAAVPEVAPEPVDCAVPELLVPGAVESLAELPAPLGSLPELFKPPWFAGPGGTPLTADGPAPAEPAAGLLLPADVPPAVPPALAPPALAPPALPPVPPPPLL
jgi:hypothetical protein